jgi:hypothetical protein
MLQVHRLSLWLVCICALLGGCLGLVLEQPVRAACDNKCRMRATWQECLSGNCYATSGGDTCYYCTWDSSYLCVVRTEGGTGNTCAAANPPVNIQLWSLSSCNPLCDCNPRQTYAQYVEADNTGMLTVAVNVIQRNC